MKTRYKFGIMLERIDVWPAPVETKFVNDYTRGASLALSNAAIPIAKTPPPMWRVFSARIHGPVMFTRRSAFWHWLKNWFTP